MKRRLFWKLWLWIVACTFPVLAPAAGQSAEDLDYFFTELGVVQSSVNGQEEKFKELNQREDGLTGGVESLGYDRSLGGDWLLHFTGRLVAERDANANVTLAQTDRWKFNVSYNTFRSYENNRVESYNFGPQTSQLPQSMELDRGATRVQAQMRQPGLPFINLDYEQRTQDGRRLLLERGTVDFFSFRNLPEFREINTDEHVASLAIRHTIAGVSVSFNQALNFFHGSLVSAENRFETGLGTSRAEERRERPGAFLSTSSLELSKSIQNKLFFTLGYRFQKTNGDGEFNKSVFDQIVGSTELKGDSEVDINNHSVSLGIRYLPLEYLTLSGELGYQNLNKKGTADNLFLTPLDVVLVTEKSESDIKDRSLEGNFGVQFSAIPRTTLDAGVELSRTNRTYDDLFASGRGFFDEYILDTDADFMRTGYWARIRLRPISFLQVSARYRWDRLIVDFEEAPVINGRGPDGGIIGDRAQRRGRADVQVRITPAPILSAILTYQDDRSKFFTFASEPDDIANTHVRTYGAGIMLVPWEWITFSTNYTFQNQWANTLASFSLENIPYKSNVHTWFNGFDIAVRKDTRLLLDSQLSFTSGEGQNTGGDGRLTSMSLNSMLQSYGIAVEHAVTKQAVVKASFQYMDLNGEDAFSRDNFSAYMFFVRLRVDIP